MIYIHHTSSSLRDSKFFSFVLGRLLGMTISISFCSGLSVHPEDIGRFEAFNFCFSCWTASLVPWLDVVLVSSSQLSSTSKVCTIGISFFEGSV